MILRPKVYLLGILWTLTILPLNNLHPRDEASQEELLNFEYLPKF